jgi:type IV pilus assembly protein PilQ
LEADADTVYLESADRESETDSLSEQEGTQADGAAEQPSSGMTAQEEPLSTDEEQLAETQPSETRNETAVSPQSTEADSTNEGLIEGLREEESWEEDGIREVFREGYTRVVFSGILSEEGYKYFFLEDPSRLVLDVKEPAREVWFNRLPLRGEAFRGIRVGRHPDKTRFVLDLREEGQPEPLVQVEENDIVVLADVIPPIDGPSDSTRPEQELPELPVDMSAEDDVIEAEEVIPESEPVAVPMGGPDEPMTLAKEDWKPVRVKKIDFLQTETSSDVVISTDGAITYDVQEKDDSLVLVLPGAQIPDHLQRPIDTQAFPSAILTVKPEQVGSGPLGKVMFTIDLREKRPYNVLEEEDGLRVSVLLPEEPPEMPLLPPPELPEREGVAKAEAEPAPEPEPAKAKEEVETPEEPTPKAAPALKPKRKVPRLADTRLVPGLYRGKKISLDFKDADIQNVLRLIAEVSQKNIVLSEAVKGKVTIRLLNVPWDMALDVILKTYALDKEELGPNILRIAPYTQLKKEREEALKAEEALERVEALQTRVVPVNYAKAGDLENLLAKLKSKRPDATILVDSRTNALIIKDLAQNIQDMTNLISQLDTQTPQVLIEAKIVELDVDFERELGIQWGTLYRAGPATGNPTGLNFPHTASVGGVVDNISGEVVNGIANPVVNLPAAVDDTAGGALGFSLASITNSFQLDAQLSALEKRNHARILSSPRVATLNNQEAKINQGQEVPYQTTSDEGTKTEFKDAKLQLSVTPQITFDRSIIMAIIVTNDTPIRDPTVGFIIGTKEAKTSVLVKDGDTAVIGGIYTNNDAETVGGVPYLMDIPVAGYFFKKKGESQKRTELIIFITPRIIPTQLIGTDEWVEEPKQE